MTDYMLEIARDKGISTVSASVLLKNSKMVHMLQNRGFTLHQSDDEKSIVNAKLDLEHAMPFATELPF